jgi:DNA-binding GntR family transcriptional regulator
LKKSSNCYKIVFNEGRRYLRGKISIPEGFAVINKYSSVPLYSQLKQIILEKIEKGEYKPDTRIPSEQEFCEIYNISRPTVRQAVNELTNNGTLYRLKGKGTFVARPKTQIDIKKYTGFTDSILDSEVPGDKEVVSLEIVNDKNNAQLSEAFSLPSASGKENEFAEVVYLTRTQNQVLSYNKSYIPLSLFPDIIEDIKDRKPSYDIFKGKYPLLPARTKTSLEVIFTDNEEAAYLNVQIGQPLLKIDTQIFSKNGQIVEYVICKYRADKCKLQFENTR